MNFSKSPKVILWWHVAYCFALYFYLWYFLVYIYDIFMVGVSLCCIIWFPNSVVRCFRMFLVTSTEMVGYRQIWGHVKKVESIKCIQHSRIVIEIILLSYFKACIVIKLVLGFSFSRITTGAMRFLAHQIVLNSVYY